MDDIWRRGSIRLISDAGPTFKAKGWVHHRGHFGLIKSPTKRLIFVLTDSAAVTGTVNNHEEATQIAEMISDLVGDDFLAKTRFGDVNSLQDREKYINASMAAVEAKPISYADKIDVMEEEIEWDKQPTMRLGPNGGII